MKLRASITQYEDVDVAEYEIKRAAYKLMCKQLNFPEGGYIRDGKVVDSWREYGGSHSWTESKILRDATEDDIAAARVINLLRWWL